MWNMKELFNILIVCTAGTDGGPSDNALYKVGPPSNPPPSPWEFFLSHVCFLFNVRTTSNLNISSYSVS